MQVHQEDLVGRNYDLMKEYLLEFGTDVPTARDHQVFRIACFRWEADGSSLDRRAMPDHLRLRLAWQLSACTRAMTFL